LAAAVVTSGIINLAYADQASKISAAGPLTALAAAPKDDGSVLLLPSGDTRPLAFTIKADTTLGGICIDCMLFQTFKASDVTGKCQECGCGSPNAVCIAWKPLKTVTWQEMLKALPPGTGLRVVYNTADKPDSGLKGLLVDRRTVLLRVSGLDMKTPEELNGLVKLFDGTKAELTAGGTQLVIRLKDDWTVEKEAKFEAALTRAGGKIVTTPIEPTPITTAAK
jgi:hypothetical protein